MRGSGLGAAAELPYIPAVAPVPAHAAAAMREMASDSLDSCMADSRSVREGGEHALHASDLGGLIDVDVGGELEHGFVLRRAIALEERLDHGHGAAMVLDHEGEKELVELCASGGVE